MALAQPSPAAGLAGEAPSRTDLAGLTVDDALRLIAHRAVRSVDDDCGSGIILLTRDGRRITSVGTNPVAERLTALYDEYRENPCRAAWHGRTTIRTGQVGGNEQGWTAKAGRLGARSLLCAAMMTGTRLLGTITVHSSRAAAFSRSDEDALQRYAAHAATLIDDTQAIRTAAFAAVRAGA